MVQQQKVINLLGIRPTGTVICHIDTFKNKHFNVIIEPITEEQEKNINRAKRVYGAIRFTKDENTIIESKDIYLYGELNFEDKDDLSLIEQFNLVNSDGNFIYSTFDYNKGSFSLVNKKVKWYPTWNAINWFKYCHCLIGKPKRVIVYKNSNKVYGFRG